MDDEVKHNEGYGERSPLSVLICKFLKLNLSDIFGKVIKFYKVVLVNNLVYFFENLKLEVKDEFPLDVSLVIDALVAFIRGLNWEPKGHK